MAEGEWTVDENGEVVPEGAVVKEDQLRALADLIAANVRANFEEIHLSGNLMDTIEVGKDFGYYMVRIPAVRYDLAKYRATHAIVYTPEKGSYADEVDSRGGFSGRHVDYVDLSIKRALYQWLADCRLNADIKFKNSSVGSDREQLNIENRKWERGFAKALREYLGDADYEGLQKAIDEGQAEANSYLKDLFAKGKDYGRFRYEFDHPYRKKTKAEKDMERIRRRYGKRKH